MNDQLTRETLAQMSAWRRDQAQQALACREKAMAQCPLFAQLCRDRDTLLTKASRETFESQKQELTNQKALQEALEKNTQAQEAALSKIGLTLTDLTPAVRCRNCGDQGYIGQPVLALCDCVRQQVLRRRCEQQSMPELNRENFESFNLELFPMDGNPSQREQMQRAQDYCLSFADSLPSPEKPQLLLMGQTGLGKTFLLNCIAHRALSRSLAVAKFSAHRLVEALSERDPSAKEAREAAYGADLLLIDDLGAEAMLNNVTLEALYSVINERYLRRKALVVATNLTPTGLMGRYADRICSRLLDNSLAAVLRLSGEDVRTLRRK